MRARRVLSLGLFVATLAVLTGATTAGSAPSAGARPGECAACDYYGSGNIHYIGTMRQGDDIISSYYGDQLMCSFGNWDDGYQAWCLVDDYPSGWCDEHYDGTCYDMGLAADGSVYSAGADARGEPLLKNCRGEIVSRHYSAADVQRLSSAVARIQL